DEILLRNVKFADANEIACGGGGILFHPAAERTDFIGAKRGSHAAACSSSFVRVIAGGACYGSR
ncbi:MAG: hypothetical protein UEU47_02430, partial [Oscillospiraceae bacterium]|nr:hypothetical protein [Oscillospiraceae bacterium]